MDSKNFGVALIGVGTATAIVGAVMLYRSRQQQALSGPSPQKQLGSTTKTKRDGMTVTHYRQNNFPIKKRVAILQDLVFKGVQDPRMRKIALNITQSCPARDDACEARAIYDAVKRRVRYTGDLGEIKLGSKGPTESVDFFSSPYRTWEFQGEDCDGHAVLVATLLALNGFTPKFRITSKTPNKKADDWSHIYTVAGFPKNDPQKLVPLDTTLPGEYFGVDPPYGKKVEFDA